MRTYALIGLGFIVFLGTAIVSAHSGRTDATGGHTCRTNCPSYGLSYGQYHYHGGGSSSRSSGYSSGSSSSSPARTCPANATYSSSQSSCVCNSGYTVNIAGTACITLPQNASAVDSPTDAWQCNPGYREVGSSCIPTGQEAMESCIDRHLMRDKMSYKYLIRWLLDDIKEHEIPSVYRPRIFTDFANCIS